MGGTKFCHVPKTLMGVRQHKGDDREIDIMDVVFIINAKYKEGEPPDPYYIGDVDGDCDVNILDVVYIINMNCSYCLVDESNFFIEELCLFLLQ